MEEPFPPGPQSPCASRVSAPEADQTATSPSTTGEVWDAATRGSSGPRTRRRTDPRTRRRTDNYGCASPTQRRYSRHASMDRGYVCRHGTRSDAADRSPRRCTDQPHAGAWSPGASFLRGNAPGELSPGALLSGPGSRLHDRAGATLFQGYELHGFTGVSQFAGEADGVLFFFRRHDFASQTADWTFFGHDY
jgi:hypothetical protein